MDDTFGQNDKIADFGADDPVADFGMDDQVADFGQADEPAGPLSERVAAYKDENSPFTRIGQWWKRGALGFGSSRAAGSAMQNIGFAQAQDDILNRIDSGELSPPPGGFHAKDFPDLRQVDIDQINQYIARSQEGRQAFRQQREQAITEGTVAAATQRSEAAAIPQNPAIEAFGQAMDSGNKLEAAKILATNPVGIISELGVESLPSILPALAAGLVNPLLGAATMGGTSAAQEYGSSLLDYLDQQGIDTSNPEAIKAAMSDPAIRDAAANFAGKRATMMGIGDTLLGILGGKMLVPSKLISGPIKREAANVFVAQPLTQAVGAAGEEALAQKASTGQITSPGAVALSGIGEFATAPVEATSFGLQRMRGAPAETPPPPSGAPATPPAPGSPPAAPSLIPGSAAQPSPPAAGGTTTPPGQNAPVEQPPASGLDVDAVVGLRKKKGPPERVRIEAVQDGYVFYRKADGSQDAAKEGDFRRDLTTAPPPADLQQGDATTVPKISTGPEAPPVETYADELARELPKPKPPAPPREPKLALTSNREMAASWMKAATEAEQLAASGAPNAKTPEQIALMKAEAARYLDLANAQQNEPDLGPVAKKAAPQPLGELGKAAPAQSEATTGAREYPVTPKAAQTPAQGALRPVERSEATEEQKLPEPAPKASEAPWQERLRTLIANRAAPVSQPEKLAKTLGVTPAELSTELTTIGSGRNAPIVRVQGTVKVNKKTGVVTQSKMAGKWKYAPKATGKVSESLSDFVRAMGGVRDDRGDLAASDLGKIRGRVGQGRLINPNARMNLEQMANAAMQAGFLVPTEAGTIYQQEQGREAVGATSADVERFKAMLGQDATKTKMHYRMGEEPEAEPEGPGMPAPKRSAQERMKDARNWLRAQGITPRGSTVEELETQVNDTLNAVGDNAPVDQIDVAREIDREADSRLEQEARDALARAGYDEAWFRQEAGLPGGEPAAPEGALEGAERSEAEPQGQEPAEGEPEGAPEAPFPDRLREDTELPLGAAPSARGVQQARDTRGKGRIPAKVPQKEPGGMFAQPEAPDTRQIDLEEAIAAKKADEIDVGSGTPGKSEQMTASAQSYLNDKTNKLAAAQEWIEARGRKTGHEYGVFTMPDGSVFWAGTANADNWIEFPVEVKVAMAMGTKPMVMQHNHPKTGGPLSSPDLSVVPYDGVGWIVAHGKDGRFSAARASDGWKALLKAKGFNQMSAAKAFEILKNFALAESMKQHRPLYEQDRAQFDTHTTEPTEAAWQALHDAGVIDYLSNTPVKDFSYPIIDNIAGAIRERLQAYGYTVDVAQRVHRPAERVSPAEGLARISGQPAQAQEQAPAGAAADTAGTQGRLFEKGGEGAAAAGGKSRRAGLLDEVGSALQRLLKDESGSLTLPEWNRVKAFFNRLRPGRTAAQVAREGNIAMLGQPDTLRHMAYIGPYLLNAAHLSSMDKPSATYWNALLNRHHTKVALTTAMMDKAKSYFALKKPAKDRVNKVLEYFRLYGITPEDTGRDIVVRIPDRIPPFGTARPVLSRPNEVIALDQSESKVVLDLFDMFRDQWRNLHEAVAREQGYQGPWSQEGIANAIATAMSTRERRRAERAEDIWNNMVQNQREGYGVPLQRYGDAFIAVRPKVQDESEPTRKPIRYEFVKTTGALDRMANVAGGGSSKRIAERKAELVKQYPPDKFEITHGIVGHKDFQELNIPALQQALAYFNMKNANQYTALIDGLLKEVFTKRMAGFRKRAENIAGYDPDFEKAILDYIHQSSGVIARMAHRQDVDSAYEGTQTHDSSDVRQYWKDFTAHLEKEGGDWNFLRKLGFFRMMWGSVAGAAINLTQTPLVTMTQLGTWAGARAPDMSHMAMLEAMRAVRPRLGSGLQVDLSKVGRTPGERAMLRTLADEGRLGPQLSQEFQGSEVRGTPPGFRPHRRILKGIWDWGASMYNAAEEVSRIAAALSSFRAAQSPQMRERLAKVYAKDQMFQQAVGRRMDPTDIARWFVDDTQFVAGKINRIPIMRGIGSVIFQFKNYVANYIRLLHKNFTRMGREGKIAGSLMLASLLAVSGLTGLPFAQDAIRMADWAVQTVRGIDPNLEYQLRDWISNDLGWGDYAAEAVTHGVGRDTFGAGLDIGGRLGMGGLFPTDSITDTMPILSAIMGDIENYGERKERGQPLAAMAGPVGWVLGKGGADLVKAYAYTQEGIKTQKGNVLVPREEVTAGQVATRALGFQPTAVSRAQERAYMSERLSTATDSAKSRMLTKFATLVVEQDEANKRGDLKEAKAIDAEIEDMLRENVAQLVDPDIPDWQKLTPPKAKTVRQKVRMLLAPEIARIKSAPKLTRETLQNMPFVEQQP